MTNAPLLRNLKYFLLSLYVLGTFANIAMNEYGLLIKQWCLLGIIIICIAEFVWYVKNEKLYTGHGAYVITCILVSAVCLSMSSDMLFGPETESEKKHFTLSGIFLIPVIVAGVLIFRLMRKGFGWAQLHHILHFIFIPLFLWNMNLPKYQWIDVIGNKLQPLPILAFFGILLLYAIQFIKSIIALFKKGGELSQFVTIYITVMFLLVWYNLLHMQEASPFNIILNTGYLMTLFYIVFNIKTNKGRVRIGDYLKNYYPGLFFFFLFFGFNYIMDWFVARKALPAPYSFSSPVAQTKLFESNKEEASKFGQSYYQFIKHRREVGDLDKE